MDFCTFAINDAYPEAICRGLRSGFLTDADYVKLKNTNTLQDFKTALEETDYADYVQFETQSITVGALRQKLQRKLADEFEYLAAQSVSPLSEFLRFIQCKYMIDNVVAIIEILKNKKNVPDKGGVDDYLADIDPLGYFPEIKNIKTVEADDFSALYSTILIDTPVGPYFIKFLEEQVLEGNEQATLLEIQASFKDLQPQAIRDSLKKIWLEEFYSFCTNNLNSLSSEVMGDLLQLEADFKCIQIVYNTIGNPIYSQAATRVTKRKKLCPTIGLLYPDCEKELIAATTLEDLRKAVSGKGTYGDLVNNIPDPSKKEVEQVDSKTIDDYMYEEEMKRYSMAFEEQSHYGVFYAYLKLKEQEIRNICWLAELVTRSQGQSKSGKDKDRNSPAWKKYIVPFNY